MGEVAFIGFVLSKSIQPVAAVPCLSPLWMAVPIGYRLIGTTVPSALPLIAAAISPEIRQGSAKVDSGAVILHAFALPMMQLAADLTDERQREVRAELRANGAGSEGGE